MAGFGDFQRVMASQIDIHLVTLAMGLLKEFEPFRKNSLDWDYGTTPLWDFVTISYNHENTVPL